MPGSWWRHFLLLLSFVLAAPAAARDDSGSVTLSPCVARVQTGDQPAAMFSAKNRFDCTTPQTAFGSGDFWLRMTGIPAKPASMSQHLILSVDWQDSMTIAALHVDGQVAITVIPSSQLSRHIAMGAVADIPLADRGSPVAAVLIKLEGAGNVSGLLRTAKIQTNKAASRAELWQMALYAGFAGLGLGLLVYNLVLWLTLRERFQLYYCAMVVAMLGYAFTFSGGASVAFPGLDSNDPIRISYVMLGLVGAGALMFTVNFFEPHAISPRSRKAAVVVGWLVTGAGCAFALLAPTWLYQLDRLYLITFVAVPVLACTMTFEAWRARSQFLWAFVLAWSLPFCMVIIRILHGAHLIDYSFVVDNSTILAMTGESLLSSLAMSYRIKLIRRERDTAIAEEHYARRLADVDPLTGLLNRRALLSRAFAAPGQRQLLLIDVDHFKQVNDEHGHDKGDEALCELALLLRNHIGETAEIARMGGEEFAVLAPGNRDQSWTAESLRQAVAEHPMSFGKPLRISIGVASGPIATEPDWRELYQAADAALYRAKHGGRNRVCSHVPGQVAPSLAA